MIVTIDISANASNSTKNNSLEILEKIANNSVEVTDIGKINDAKGIIQESDLIFNYVDAELDFENVIVLDTNVEGEIYTSITIPIIGKNYSILSNVTCTMLNNQIVAYNESLITTGDDGNLVIINYVNGTFFETVETGVYLSDEEIEEELNSINEIVKNAPLQRNTAACLAGLLGIDVGLAAVLVSMCAGSCPAVPAVCAACVGAVATVGVGNMAALVACFNV